MARASQYWSLVTLTTQQGSRSQNHKSKGSSGTEIVLRMGNAPKAMERDPKKRNMASRTMTYRPAPQLLACDAQLALP
jgi:hypothetical protein